MKKRYLWLVAFVLCISLPCQAADDEFLHKQGTQIVFADHANDFSPTAANDLQVGTPTTVELQTASVADTAAVESDKFDFGAERAFEWTLSAAVEMAATPTTGEILEFYLSESGTDTAATANPGYCDGGQGAYDGGVATLAEGVKQLLFLGALICSADATTTVQIQKIAKFTPSERWGILVVKNESGAAFHSDDVETHFVMTPVVTFVNEQ